MDEQIAKTLLAAGLSTIRLCRASSQIRLGLMETVDICDARTRLSQLVDQAASGEDVVVSRNGKSLVRITRLEEPKRRIKFGLLKGKVTIHDDFDAPLPQEALDGFGGR